jgi:hypothetical protein
MPEALTQEFPASMWHVPQSDIPGPFTSRYSVSPVAYDVLHKLYHNGSAAISRGIRGRPLTRCGVAGEHEWLHSCLDHIDCPKGPKVVLWPSLESSNFKWSRKVWESDLTSWGNRMRTRGSLVVSRCLILDILTVIWIIQPGGKKLGPEVHVWRQVSGMYSAMVRRKCRVSWSWELITNGPSASSVLFSSRWYNATLYKAKETERERERKRKKERRKERWKSRGWRRTR